MARSPEDELKAFQSVNKEELTLEGEWAVLDARWYQHWQAYVGIKGKEIVESNGRSPGRIDNTRLQNESNPGALRLDITEKKDYVIVNKEVWDLFKGWYGGEPEFLRVAVPVGVMNEPRVDLYPTFFQITTADAKGNPGELKTLHYNSKTTLLAVVATFLDKKIIDDAGKGEDNLGARVWIKNPSDPPQKALEESDPDYEEKKKEHKDGFNLLKTNDLNGALDIIFPPQVNSAPEGGQASPAALPLILVEKPLEDGSYARYVYQRRWNDFRVGDQIDCRDPQGSWYGSDVLKVEEKRIYIHYQEWGEQYDEWIEKTDGARLAPFRQNSKPRNVSYSSYSGGWSSSYYADDSGTPLCNGQVGLRNLGNTCFMNSTIQCLTQTPKLTEFFVNREYVQKINRDNALGWKGKIAEEWGALMEKIWSNKYTVVAPRSLKDSIGEFQPRFSGYQQQDSQELLSFLLDGLHEDLNEIIKKPVTSGVESKGRPDKEVADESWEVYQKRNKSYIVDTVMGQLKSRLTCPDCQRVSITFDPFMFLSAPLPTTETKQYIVNVISANPDTPVTAYGIVVSINGRVADMKKLVSDASGIPYKRLVAGEAWHYRTTLMTDDMSVNEFRDDVHMWEVPTLDHLKEGDYALVPVINQVLSKDPYYNPQYSSKPYKTDNVGVPLVVAIPAMGGAPTNWAVSSIVSNALKGWKSKKVPEGAAEGEAAAAAAGGGGGGGAPVEEKKTEAGESAAPQSHQIVLLNDSGYGCLVHGYNCNGCPIPADKEAFQGELTKQKQPKYMLAVQWFSAEAYDSERAKIVKHHSADASHRSKQDSIDLRDCLEAFRQPETLSESDAWYCSSCRKHVCAEKKMDMWRLPDVFICHLKRFSYTKVWREKIGTFVDFPLVDLKLGQFCANPEFKDVVYDLYAVSNHMGGMGGGHYTAYVKNLTTGRWFEMDDSRVSEVAPKSVKTSAAYVLFYHRRGLAKHPVLPEGVGPISESHVSRGPGAPGHDSDDD